MLEFKSSPEIGWVFVAVIGGIAKFFDSYIKGEQGMNFGKFAALLFVSGFCGFMTAGVVAIYDPKWVTVAAGVGGFAGTKIIEVGVDAIRKRLGVRKNAEE